MSVIVGNEFGDIVASIVVVLIVTSELRSNSVTVYVATYRRAN